VGGFLVEWARSGRDMISSLRAGCLTGAGAVTQIGGSTVPNSLELAEYEASMLQSAPLNG
jgi:sugar/nucleoside kinase (ribokinase family)